MPKLEIVPGSAEETRMKTSHKTEPRGASGDSSPGNHHCTRGVDTCSHWGSQHHDGDYMCLWGTVGILARIAANAKKFEAVPSNATSETCGEMCGVHGTSLPATSSSRVWLHFHAGQAWYPIRKGKRLPSFSFPPAHFHPDTWRTCCAPSVFIGTRS